MIYHVPADLFEAIVRYLANRPYSEVAEAMSAIAPLQPQPAAEPKERPVGPAAAVLHPDHNGGH